MARALPQEPDLPPHVAGAWSRVFDGGDVLPDGCVDVVWTGSALVVAGPATLPTTPALSLGTTVFGVRFRIGAAGAALGLPADELLDRSVPLVELWGREGAEIDERVAAGGLPALVDSLGARLRGAAGVDPLTRAAAISLARPRARVDELGERLGISERQLRRRLAGAVGYGPKTLARVLRLQRFLALAAAPARSADLGRLALDAGYADQAHLTRECGALAGRTPSALLALGTTAAGETALALP